MEVKISRREWIAAEFTAPPSKSHTHRALVAASLADGRSFVSEPLLSDDIEVTVASLKRMGVCIESRRDGFAIEGTSGVLGCDDGCMLDMRDSGTSMRFFTALAALARGSVTIDGSKRLRERPVGPLAMALRQLGADVNFLGSEGYPPLRVHGPLRGGEAWISASESSQYISALLLVAPCASSGVRILCTGGIVSRPYVDVTLEIMEHFGVRVRRDDYTEFRVDAGSGYRGRDYRVEGDYSSAGYFFAIAAVCGGRVRVKNLRLNSKQADALLLQALEQMGCRVRAGEDEVILERTSALEGIEIDMHDAPDAVQTLAMVAAFASSPTRIRGISHLKYKESDRIEAIVRTLSSAGGKIKVEKDALLIEPAPLNGATIDPKGDHRTAMSAAVLGLGAGGITIIDAECVSKSFPDFWNELERADLL